MILGKGVLKICSKFTGEHPCRSLLLSFDRTKHYHFVIFRFDIFWKEIELLLELKQCNYLYFCSHTFDTFIGQYFLIEHDNTVLLNVFQNAIYLKNLKWWHLITVLSNLLTSLLLTLQNLIVTQIFYLSSGVTLQLLFYEYS